MLKSTFSGLQFTTLSLTIRVCCLYSFRSCCLPNLRNPKNFENSNL